jgi:hypothetical protein
VRIARGLEGLEPTFTADQQEFLPAIAVLARRDRDRLLQANVLDVADDTGFVITVVGVRHHFGLSPLLASFFLTVWCRTVGVVFDAWVWLERLATAGANFGAHQISPYENSYGNC